MKTGISKKLLIGLLIFTIVVTVFICSIVAISFDSKIIERYTDLGTSITSSLAARIDGDRIEGYLQSGEPDLYYNEVLKFIDGMHEHFHPLYIYVCIPTDECVLYLWSNGFTGEETIGFTTEYADGGRDWMQGIFYGEDVYPLAYAVDPEFGRIATAATPIYDSNGNPVAIAAVDFSIEEIDNTVTSIVIKIVLLIFAIMLTFIVIFYRFVERNVAEPLGKLTSASKVLTGNLDRDETYKSDIHTGDEIEELSQAFEKMDEELRDYISENLRINAEKERIGAELNMAASIQASQLPSEFPAFPDRRDFDIYASMTPAKTVGGDFYDFFLVDEDHIALVMADVSGKGIPAALFMMISKLLIQSRVMMGESPAEALNNTNAQLMQNNQAHQFVTVWLAIIDLNTGKGVAANAGHEHPVHKKKDGKYELVEYKHSPPVATMRKTKFKEHEFEIAPGDSFFVYTDGVAEATDSNNELFGTDRMLEALNRDPDVSCEQILKNVNKGIDDFVAGAEQFDDITMLSFKFNGPEHRGDVSDE